MPLVERFMAKDQYYCLLYLWLQGAYLSTVECYLPRSKWSVLAFSLFWPNTWEHSLKEGVTYFDSWFKRTHSISADPVWCDWQNIMMAGVCPSGGSHLAMDQEAERIKQTRARDIPQWHTSSNKALPSEVSWSSPTRTTSYTLNNMSFGSRVRFHIQITTLSKASNHPVSYVQVFPNQTRIWDLFIYRGSLRHGWLQKDRFRRVCGCFYILLLHIHEYNKTVRNWSGGVGV